MGRPKAPRPGMPTWLPPAFTAPCRKSQADAPSNRNGCAVSKSSKNFGSPAGKAPESVARITLLFGDASRMQTDLNADVGESFGTYVLGQDPIIMPCVTSVSVACGFHAGDPGVMRETVSLARHHGVAVGAH